VIALKALGIQSDKEILLLTAGSNEAYKTAFSSNLEEAAKLGVYTRHQALEYIGSRVKVNRRIVGPRRPAWEEALEALATIVLAHVPVNGMDFRSKAIFVATMTRRVLMAMDDEKMVDDRDYVGNKRLELLVVSSVKPSPIYCQLPSEQVSYSHCFSKISSRLSMRISNPPSTRSSKNRLAPVNLMLSILCNFKAITLHLALFGPSPPEIGL
jgi:hypothetical protein